MKNFNEFLLILFVHLIFLSSAHSETFYINAAIGNNNNTSTQAKNIATPWLTVQFAIDNSAVVNGDNLVVAEGTYSGFELTKRLNIIGAWKGGTPTVNTIFNSSVDLSATGGSPTERMLLKNLRVAASSADAIGINKGYVTLENVFATTTGLSGIRINDFFIKDIVIESCNLNNNNYAGIFIPSFCDIDGLIIRNTTFNNNGYFGIVAFQTQIAPSEIKNVEISHCAFVDNNPTNQEEGHSIYFEKLKNAIFKNITIVIPPGNVWIGIDINLIGRTDFSNITIENSRITRATPGSGIWVQARNDLSFPPAALDNVVLRGLTFNNCDTNIAFNRQVSDMTVDKCDLSTYLVYGIVNFTYPGGTIEAANNKWQGGGVPDTTVVSEGVLVTGSPVISSLPSTDGISTGMCIMGQGIQPGSTVIGKSLNTVTMSNPAIASGFIEVIGFNFACVPSSDIVRTPLNFVHPGNPLPNVIVNQTNVSFPDLASAISGTTIGGTIWNLPNATIPGTTVIDKDLTLMGPGAGFLNSFSLTTFQNLTISGADLTMGSDFAVSNNFTPNHVRLGNDNTLIINGAIIPGGLIEGGERSDMFFGGTGPSTGLTTVEGGLRTLHLNRASGIALLDSLRLHRLLFLQNGLLTLDNINLTLEAKATIFNPFPAASYVNTNGTGELRKNFVSSSPTAFNFTIGRGGYSPFRIFFASWHLDPGNYLGGRVVNAKQPQNECPTDYLNRYWVLNQTGLAPFNVNIKFSYVDSDVVGTEANIYGAQWDGFGFTIYTPVDPATNTFTTNGVFSLGEFTGGALNCLNDLQTKINVKAFLQGAYEGGGTMRTSLLDNGILPLTQPYAGSQFNYNGTETVASIPAGVVDWVYLEIRETSTGLAIPSGRRAAFMKSDGSIVDLDGTNPVKVNVMSGNYFIVIGHRNHLPVMSKLAQTLNTSSALYDFSTGLGKYFGDDAAALSGGLFGMYAGDGNKSFVVTSADFITVTTNLLQTNYNQGDINLSAVVTSADYILITTNLLKASNVPGYPPIQLKKY